MSFKEVAPAFIWAAVVVGVTSAVVAADHYHKELTELYYAATYHLSSAR
jgi:hypothetical protein